MPFLKFIGIILLLAINTFITLVTSMYALGIFMDQLGSERTFVEQSFGAYIVAFFMFYNGFFIPWSIFVPWFFYIRNTPKFYKWCSVPILLSVLFSILNIHILSNPDFKEMFKGDMPAIAVHLFFCWFGLSISFLMWASFRGLDRIFGNEQNSKDITQEKNNANH